MPKPPRTYIPTPVVEPAVRARYQVVLEVLAGTCSVSAGARQLGLSRYHFQTLLHRGLEGLLRELAPKPPGRPKRSAGEQTLQQEAERLRRENAKLQARVQTTDRLLEVASGFLHGRIQGTGRAARRKKTTPPRRGGHEAGEDPDGGGRRACLEGVQALRRLGVTAALAAQIMGVSAATVARWTAATRRRTVTPAARRAPVIATAVTTEVSGLVRRLHGLIGAEALRRSVPGLSRRQAAALKRATLVAMERERVAAAERITVTVPGVVRGFDAMHVRQRYLLVASDGCVPYRTSLMVSDTYDSRAVARAIERDLLAHGAPLVYRLDRAKAHQTPRVRAVLEAAGVLALHGPPRYPGYYGQLERQNREHRAWLTLSDEGDELDELCGDMLKALNGYWRRASLGWQTPAEHWNRRPMLAEDRAALRDEVQAQAARLREHLDVRGAPADLPERLAIEQALTHRGYLRRERGGWC
jgi:transposase